MQKEKVVKISSELHKQLKLIAVSQEKELGKLVDLIISTWIETNMITNNKYLIIK